MNRKNGQAAIELAVFGAILIFILGGIVRAALSNSYQQNQQLKAMRMAMLASYQSSQAANSSRNSASILFIEDRLSPDFNKYGSLERTPYIVSGAGTFNPTRLFYPLDDWEVANNLSIMDVYINGQHFPLTTTRLVMKPITLPVLCAPTDQQCLRNQREWIWDRTRCPSDSSLCSAAALPPYCRRAGDTADVECGHKLFYTIVANGTSEFCAQWPCGGNELTKEQAFDLKREGPPYADNPKCDADPHMDMCGKMAWQWSAVTSHPDSNGGCTLRVDAANNQFPSYDVDGDLREETIYGVSGYDGACNPTEVKVLDSQDGDMDLTYGIDSPGPKPGLQKDMQIYTFTKEGTYLQIKEGELYNPETQQTVRSVTKRDQVDLVQRMFQLSNDTGRFCDASHKSVPKVDGGPNPVEACNDCFQNPNIKKTCFDQPSKMLFIRSRLKDQRGHAWITDVSGKLGIGQ